MDEIIYRIISNPVPTDGLFALWRHVASHIVEVYEEGDIPVIDLQHCQNILFKDGREYKDNTWEYFFKQPASVGLGDLKNKKIKFCHSNHMAYSHKMLALYPKHLLVTKEDTRQHPYAKRYAELLQWNNEMKQYFEETKAKYFGDEKDILGIVLRGTDYVVCKPSGHPIQPTVDEVIEKAKKLKEQLGYKKIYVATEDNDYYKRFKQEFGSMLIENIQYKYNRANVNAFLCDIKIDRKDHLYNLQKEYAGSMYLISQCKYLIGGMSSAALMVYLMSNLYGNFDYVYLWDKGSYSNSSTSKDSLLEKIFSIKNKRENNKIHKVLTILGIKMKFGKEIMHF